MSNVTSRRLPKRSSWIAASLTTLVGIGLVQAQSAPRRVGFHFVSAGVSLGGTSYGWPFTALHLSQTERNIHDGNGWSLTTTTTKVRWQAMAAAANGLLSFAILAGTFFTSRRCFAFGLRDIVLFIGGVGIALMVLATNSTSLPHRSFFRDMLELSPGGLQSLSWFTTTAIIFGLACLILALMTTAIEIGSPTQRSGGGKHAA